ncbi:putative E3 ubiquitin-protein ligase LIN-1 isoform X2 [Gastrolobium bilobum]|uniref:putative E3 ubiquitin-protein ligase LIN-1 isoform X2 n=1 Tax=Gastrolobium bilobum TaxID=150636 RepID=UPI002AB09563|nr:putative E3 ubiquitin-protein ligase LIN-1 isoform X2 [Gastrolobium bilobum]
MASSLEELLAEEGFKGRRRVTRSRFSFHNGALSEPLYSFEERLCVSSERIKTHRTKSDASQSQIRSGPLQSDTHTAKNRRPRDSLFIRDKMDERLKNETEKKRSTDKKSEDSIVEDIYSDQVSNSRRGKEKNFNELVGKQVKDPKMSKMHSRSSSNHMLGHWSGNRKSIKSQEDSYTRSNSKNIEDGSNKNRDHAMQIASSFALDEVAVQAIVSILNGYIKRFLKDEDFRSTLRHNCFSSLNFVELEEENNTETKVIRSLEHAIETVEQTAEEPISTTYLKRATMQLSIITGLSLNDLKYGFTCGIPNYKLSACAHLYLSVVYMIQRKKEVSAKHLLQVFCDSPFQARTILLPELWEHLFSPQLSHLKAWCNKEAEILVDAASKTGKLKLLQKVYDEHLDSGTHTFAVYYKDWLAEGVESPSIPSIGIPSISVTGSQQVSSHGHSSESASSPEPFSPQPLVSKKLYDSVFGNSSKPGVYEVKDNEDEDKLENCVRGSYGSTIVEQTIVYESETVKFTDQDVEDFTQSVLVGAFHPQKGTSMMAVEEWQETNLSNEINNSFSIQTNLNSGTIDAQPHGKVNELALRRVTMSPNKISSAVEGSFFPSIPQEFICPLNGNLFEEPVTLETGQTFEREAIKAWFEKGNRTCPVTGNTLECVVMPLTNLILKRLIDNWKSEHFSHLLDFAFQTVGNSKELKLKKRDEATVFKLKSLLSSLQEEDKSTYAKRLISLGVLSFLLRRFELGNVEEKSQVLSLLINCIQADSDCIFQIAKSIDRKCLCQLLHSKEVTSITNAIVFLTELVSMKRRKDVTSFISSLAGEDVFNTMHVLLIYLANSSPHEKPLIAVLLLHFDLLVEPQKFSIYREMAVNAIAVGLDASLNDEKARVKCCRALLILCGHFSSTGKTQTMSSILKQAGYNNDSSQVKPPSHEEEGQHSDVTISLEDEEERGEELQMNLLESLIGNGESPFLKTISSCLDSRHLDLVRACLITVTWLSSSLCTLFNAGVHLPALLTIISQLKGILENGELEFKTLASMSLLNFSKISECRTLLKTMAEDIAPLLHGLIDVTWPAKQLHAIVSGENL